MSKGVSPKDVAIFMKKKLSGQGSLYQEVIVYEIKRDFGKEFVYINRHGNLAIDKEVLDEFRKITPNVVWVRGERYWRYREDYDEPSQRVQ